MKSLSPSHLLVVPNSSFLMNRCRISTRSRAPRVFLGYLMREASMFGLSVIFSSHSLTDL